jgi:hypothetical protein
MFFEIWPGIMNPTHISRRSPITITRIGIIIRIVGGKGTIFPPIKITYINKLTPTNGVLSETVWENEKQKKEHCDQSLSLERYIPPANTNLVV